MQRWQMPTRTPAPVVVTPAATLTPQLVYHTLSLDHIANTTIREGYSNPVFGRVQLNGVEFYLSDAALNTTMTQTEGESNLRLPTSLHLANLAIPNTHSVHVLVTGGNVRKAFQDRQVGRIVLEFANGQDHTTPLVLGRHLREWHLASDGNVITTADSAVSQVYTDMRTDGVGVCVIDMLTIRVPEALRSHSSLTAIRIVDKSVELVGDLKPAINLLGLSVLAEK